MNLTIDQGNSSTKIGFFHKGELSFVYNINFPNQKMLGELINLHPSHKAILSSVSSDSGYDLAGWLKKNIEKVFIFDHQTPLPFKNNYQTPETLGKDRLAALAGAQFLYPSLPLLVIDAGTALTFDLMVDDVYLGGNISPGLQMRFKALHQQTNRLPLAAPDRVPFWGRSTTEAITAGVQNGLLMEVEGYCREVMRENPQIKVIITGGDADFFARNIKNIIFVHSNLVLQGLNRLIEYNV